MARYPRGQGCWVAQAPKKTQPSEPVRLAKRGKAMSLTGVIRVWVDASVNGVRVEGGGGGYGPPRPPKPWGGIVAHYGSSKLKRSPLSPGLLGGSDSEETESNLLPTKSHAFVVVKRRRGRNHDQISDPLPLSAKTTQVPFALLIKRAVFVIL